MGSERRSAPRYKSRAQAVFEMTGERGNLVDISVTGCMVELGFPVSVSGGESYTIKIFPDKESGVFPFSITARVVWLNEVHGMCYAGLEIDKSPTGEEFQNYVDYLAYYGRYRRAHID